MTTPRPRPVRDFLIGYALGWVAAVLVVAAVFACGVLP